MFVTLTAPSFGPVHTRAARHGRPAAALPAAARRAGLPARRPRSPAARVHDEDDPCLGEPLCVECFDHAGAVVWNNPLGELWRRTTIYLPRTLARWLTNRTQKRLRELVRVSYVKVAEYQRRGLVHLHVVIRLDRAMPDYRARRAPPARRGASTSSCSSDAVRATVDDGQRAAPGRARRRPRRAGAASSTSAASTTARCRGELAGYLAKYATKSTEQAGGVLHRVTEHEVDELPVSEHVRAYLREAFELDAEPELADRRFGAHRARARLPRPLPDQVAPLLDDVQAAARRPRGVRARAAARPLARHITARDRRGRARPAARRLRARRRRATSQLSKTGWPRKGGLRRVRREDSRARSA